MLSRVIPTKKCKWQVTWFTTKFLQVGQILPNNFIEKRKKDPHFYWAELYESVIRFTEVWKKLVRKICSFTITQVLLIPYVFHMSFKKFFL